MTSPRLGPKVLAEFLGTAFLLAAIVGSGAMAQRLTDDVGIQLLQNAVATTTVLAALIVTFGVVSGAHFNPAVTLTDRLMGNIDNQTTAAFIVAQIAGGAIGVVSANIMFDFDPVVWSTNDRATGATFFAEFIATIGLLLVIYGVSRSHSLPVVAAAVGGYITGAYAFTSSTSFANPAVTLARTLTDTFAGIRPASAPAFIGAQLGSVIIAYGLIRYLFPDTGAVEKAEADNADTDRQ